MAQKDNIKEEKSKCTCGPECKCGPECNCKKELIDGLQKKNEEYLNGWKRERADFLNYKKEEMERISELIKYANEELILKMLPILDNFLIAEKNIPEEAKKDKNTAGLLHIHQHLKDFLKSQGIEEIKTVGERFNPNFMESVAETESATSDVTPSGDKKEAGMVIEETQKGYTLFGRVIRPAKVKVSK